jgi:hypothetical protein
MKTISSICLGLLSSAFLSVGLLRAAQVFDPNVQHSALRAAANSAVCDGCSGPCQTLGG